MLIASVVFLIIGVVKVKSLYDSVLDTPQKKEIVADTVTKEVEKQVDKILK
jgi:adenylylsulfate kinase-like enzyme